MVRFRRLVLAVAPVAAVVMLAGCGTPAGVDKNLVDEWAMLAAPKVPSPPVGSCYDSTVPYFETDTVTIFSFTAVASCTTAHISETFYVGELSGTAASATSPPKGADLKDAWSKCNTEAQTFLGGDFHDGRLEMLVLPPSSAQWSGGGRYFRCDLAEVQSDAGKPVSRTSSLKGGLTGDKPIALTCAQETYEADGKTWEDFEPTTCTATHNMEYVGTYSAGERAFPKTADERRAAMRTGCEALGAKFLGMTQSTLDNHQEVGIGFWMVDEENWLRGNRAARCYAMLYDKKSTIRSLKGLGTGKI